MTTVLSIIFCVVAGLFCNLARAEPGVSANSVTLGQSIYLTGGLAALGNDLTTGAKLYFEQINAKGGVHGRKILLETLDDAYNPVKAKENALTLIDSRQVFALFQFAGTGSVEAVAPIVDQKQVPLCAAVATGPELRGKRFNQVFYVRAGNEQEINVITRHLATIERKRFAVIYLDAPYGRQGRAVAVQAAQNNKLIYVGDAVIAVGTSDAQAFEKAARIIAALKPDSVLLVTAGKATTALVGALGQQGIRNDQLYALAAALSASEIKELGLAAKGLVVSQVIPNPVNRSQAMVLDFTAAITKAGLKPNHALLEGWINAAVCTSALKKAGSKLDRAAFVKALETIDENFAGMRVRFDKLRHGGSDYVELTFVKDADNYSK
jgi:branched-chain amino acid transport system substrate-binding protein